MSEIARINTATVFNNLIGQETLHPQESIVDFEKSGPLCYSKRQNGVKENDVALKPKNISMEQAASIPLVALTWAQLSPQLQVPIILGWQKVLGLML